MEPMTNDYYPVTCPHCRKHLVIRLHHDEAGDTPCQCKRNVCTVEWAMRTVERNGQQVQTYAPELIEKIAKIVTEEMP
jgi:hypothetical protein